ncbi:bomanin-836 [Drosophila eugracilis]|uniref:bomanin-836 n=1 Tax=Drosophila eugracilis TaxID=29029 RepID=UPI0007E5D1D8|nr:bomanin-836 [Drosophila eugracilis]
MKSLQVAGTLMLLFCLLAAVNATPGKVYINGKCIDCNKPDDDKNIIIPSEMSGSMSYTLTTGAMVFGILYHIFS